MTARLERQIALDERYGRLRLPFSEKVREYYDLQKENPNPLWVEHLIWLLSNFPQVDKRGIRWVLEGGGAISFYHPGQRVPKDVDILTADKNFEALFGSPGIFDVRTAEFWLKVRELPFTPQKVRYLTQEAIAPMAFNDGIVWMSVPPIIAVSKLPEYSESKQKGTPREKDKRDLELMNVNPEKIERVLQRLRAAA